MKLKGLEKRLKGLLFEALSPFKGKRRQPSLIDISRVRRVLVVRGDERLGNLLMLTPFFALLRSSFPRAEVWALVGDKFSSLLEGNPHIKGFITWGRNPLGLVRFLVRVMGKRFDLAFDCSHQDSLSFNNGLFTFLSLAPYRIGFRRRRPNPFLNVEIPPPPGKVHQIEAYFTLLSPFGNQVNSNGMEVSLTKEEVERAKGMLKSLGVDPSSFLVGIHPGGRRDKRWDLSKFASLAQGIKERYGFPLLIFWGPGERDIWRSNQELFSPWAIFSPELKLREFASLLSLCRIFISGDCGPMHLASALGIPTLSVFLVDNFWRYAPQGPHHRVVYRKGGPEVEDLLVEFHHLLRELQG